MTLVSRLIQALQRFQDDYRWDLAGPALRRAAAMSARLTEMDEHLPLATALRGRSPQDSPFDLSVFTTLPMGPNTQPIASIAAPAVLEPDPQVMWDWSGVEWNFADLLGRPDSGHGLG